MLPSGLILTLALQGGGGSIELLGLHPSWPKGGRCATILEGPIRRSTFCYFFPLLNMQQTCVERPSTVEMLDALEAGIAALRERHRQAGTPEDRPAPAVPRPNRTHPFSRIEEL